MTHITKRHEFLEAVKYGDMEEVQRLQPHFCHTHPILAAIDLAVLYDQRECLTFLLSVADNNNPISVSFPAILHSAVISGRNECVGIILPYVNDEEIWRWSWGAQNIIRVCYTKPSTVEFFD